jgi:hypothetical protein
MQVCGLEVSYAPVAPAIAHYTAAHKPSVGACSNLQQQEQQVSPYVAPSVAAGYRLLGACAYAASVAHQAGRSATASDASCMNAALPSRIAYLRVCCCLFRCHNRRCELLLSVLRLCALQRFG